MNEQGRYEKDSEEDEPLVQRLVEEHRKESRPRLKMIQGSDLTEEERERLCESIRPPRENGESLGRL